MSSLLIPLSSTEPVQSYTPFPSGPRSDPKDNDKFGDHLQGPVSTPSCYPVLDVGQARGGRLVVQG